MENSRTRLGEKIRTGRLAAGLTQEELAERLRRAQASVSAWEAGKQIPAVDALLAISRELDVAAEDLLELAGQAVAEGPRYTGFTLGVPDLDLPAAEA